ncbi:MAG: methyltransferase domain-containing protein [Candidatus Omnitrophota bacterium]
MKNNYEVDIYALAYGGAGIGKLDGKVCFVEGALPGERVSFRKLSDKKSFSTGFVTKIIKPSSDRIEPICPHYGRCGGCQYQHLNYEKEVFYKAQQVQEVIKRIGGVIEYSFEPMALCVPEYGYRSSVTLHKTRGGYGYFSRDNQNIIAIDRCPLAVDKINGLISTLDTSNGKRDVTLRSDKLGNVWKSNHQGHRFFKDDYIGTELTFSPLAFSQANRQISIDMVRKLRGWLKQEKPGVLFDLYCGVGFFGILMRDLFESVIGIDDSPIAIDCAKISKRDIAADNVKFYCNNVTEKFPVYYQKHGSSMNTIILDPPRAGIDKELAAYLLNLKNTSCLCYISCDPATLARDIKLLAQEGGWSLDRISCFDMFARTKHIESIALFKR